MLVSLFTMCSGKYFMPACHSTPVAHSPKGYVIVTTSYIQAEGSGCAAQVLTPHKCDGISDCYDQDRAPKTQI